MPKPRSTKADPFGNLDAISDASWEARWMRWDKPAQDAYLATIASWGPLNFAQMSCLIQGLLPPTYEWLPLPTCMAEFIPMVTRLQQDMDRGVLSKAPTPNEFAAWCDQMNLELPGALVHAIQAAELSAQTPKPITPQSTISIVVPSWAAMLVKGTATREARSPPKRGRPRASESTNDVLRKDGAVMLMEAARTGEIMTLTAIAEQLQSTPCGQGKSIDNIARRLKGQLPTAQARATATRHRPGLLQRRVKALY